MTISLLVLVSLALIFSPKNWLDRRGSFQLSSAFGHEAEAVAPRQC